MPTINKHQYEALLLRFADAAAYELHREQAQFWFNPETLDTKVIHIDKGDPFPPFNEAGFIELYASEKNRVSLSGMLQAALKRNNIAVEA